MHARACVHSPRLVCNPRGGTLQQPGIHTLHVQCSNRCDIPQRGTLPPGIIIHTTTRSPEGPGGLAIKADNEGSFPILANLSASEPSGMSVQMSLKVGTDQEPMSQKWLPISYDLVLTSGCGSKLSVPMSLNVGTDQELMSQKTLPISYDL
eukprot:5376319-Karenia_brevis.AAC.1